MTTTTRSRVPLLALALLAIFAGAAAAQGPAPAPITLGDDVVFSTTIRSRTYDWNWFGGTSPGDYVYQGTFVRFGLTQTKKKYDWQLELEAPFMIGLPDGAVQPPPRGQLGLGAAYYAANDNSVNPAHLFLKQAYVRFKGLGGIDGQSLKIGRQEFNDSLEATPKDPTLVALNRDRISQRLLGNFSFSDVLRSFDGALYQYGTPAYTVTAMGARPTEGVFQVNGWKELDINVFYASVIGRAGNERNPGTWRLLGIYYDDYRHNALKIDNRSAAVRNADAASIAIGTFGGNFEQVVSTPAGAVDLLFWGVGQAGSWGALSHRAGAYAVEGGWQPSGIPALKPWVRVGYDYNSGDSNPNDSKHGTFFQMLPTARIYARMPFFNLMNNVDAFGELILRPSTRLTVRSDVHALSLADSHDLWYGGGGAFQAGTFGFSGRPSNGHTGLATLWDLSGDVTINPHVALGLYYAYAHSGDVVHTIYPSSAGGSLAFAEWLIRF